MQRWEYRPQESGLTLCNVPIPEPGPREALVKVKAVSLNYRDAALIDGAIDSGPDGVLVPGSDMSGEVVRLGPDAKRFSIGDRVISADTMNWIDGPAPPYETNSVPLLGRLAEYVCVPEDRLVADRGSQPARDIVSYFASMCECSDASSLSLSLAFFFCGLLSG